MSRIYVLDANPVLSLLSNTASAGRVDQLIREADRLRHSLLMSVANWGEVFYITWARHGDQAARNTMRELQQLPLQVVPLDTDQALKAGEIKALHGIPYVDCMAAALAFLRGGTLVTSDRHFEKLGKHFPVLWISR